MFYTIGDMIATLNEEFYETEGKVIDSYIETKRFRFGRQSNKTRYEYFHHITLDNENGQFKMELNDRIVDIELNKTYKIKALPFTKTILEYEEIKNE